MYSNDHVHVYTCTSLSLIRVYIWSCLSLPLGVHAQRGLRYLVLLITLLMHSIIIFAALLHTTIYHCSNNYRRGFSTLVLFILSACGWEDLEDQRHFIPATESLQAVSNQTSRPHHLAVTNCLLYFRCSLCMNLSAPEDNFALYMHSCLCLSHVLAVHVHVHIYTCMNISGTLERRGKDIHVHVQIKSLAASNLSKKNSCLGWDLNARPPAF